MKLPKIFTFKGSTLVYLFLVALSKLLTSLTPSDYIVLPSIWGIRFVLPKSGYASGARPITIMLGLVEPQWRTYFLKFIKKAKVLIDVGAASDGYYSLLAAKLNKNIVAVALEPLLTEYRYLSHNVYINGFQKRVICINMGLSDKVTYLKLENRNVIFTRLDQLVKALKLPQVDIIKIDVEGHGHEVILGAIETIKKYRPIIFYEVHNHHEKNTIEALSTLSYQIIEEPGDMYILIPSTKT